MDVKDSENNEQQDNDDSSSSSQHNDNANSVDKELEEREIRKKQLHIHWRRNQVLDMLADGYTQTAIASELKVSEGLISQDISYLRNTAKERLREHIEEQLPFAIQQCLIRLQKSLHETVQLKEKLVGEPKLQLQATQIIDDIAVKIVDITAHIEPVNNLLSHIIKKTEKQVNDLKKQADKAEEVKAVGAQSTTVLTTDDTPGTEETSNSDTDAGAGDSADTTESDNTTDAAEQDSRVF
jgi:hypothetical protein